MSSNPYLPPQGDVSHSPDPPVQAALVGEDGGMKVDFELRREDLIAFAIFLGRPTPEAARRQVAAIIVILIFLSGALAVFVYLAIGNRVFWALVISWSGLMIWMVSATPWPFLRSFRERRLRPVLERTYNEAQYLRLYGPCNVVLTPQFVSVSGSLAGGATRWIAFERMAATEEALYICNVTGGSVLVPRRAFSSDDHFQTFVQTAQEYHTRALAAENPQQMSP